MNAVFGPPDFLPRFTAPLMPRYPDPMRYPGEVWFLPPDAREDGDNKARRHVLLAPCSEAEGVGIFSFASSAATESRFGGAAVLLDPHASRYNRSGFDHPTYITPCRLVCADAADMTRMTGRIIDEMPAIRAALHSALGIRTGTCAGSGTAAGSWRGRIVRLGDAFFEEAGVEFALIVSEPAYSLQRRYQIVVPLLDADDYEETDMDLSIEGTGWLRGVGMNRGLLCVPHIQSVFHPTEVAADLGMAVDEATMREIDTYLLQIFGL